MAEVKVAGYWLAGLPGVVTDLTWATTWGSDSYSGPVTASWKLSIPFESSVPYLRPGSSVEIYRGGVRVWNGVLNEPVRGVPWEFNASGLGSLASNFAALTSTGAPTTIPQIGVQYALTRGLAWAGGASAFSASAYGEPSPYAMNRLDVLLNDSAQKNAQRWGVDANGIAFVRTDPTTPKYVLDAHDAEIGVADEGLYTNVQARYVASVTGTPPVPATYGTVTSTDANAVARYGTREYVLDLTKLGGLTSATAQLYADSMLKDLTIPAWVNSLTVDATKLRTMGGLPADIASVRAGEMVRLFGARGNLGRLGNELMIDVVLGDVSYVDGATDLTIAPMKLAKRTFADVLDAFDPDSGAQFKWR